MVSIIVPALNEAAEIAATLRTLQDLEGDKEIVVVDGGSDDGTAELAAQLGTTVVHTNRGRGVQQHTGAEHANGDVLWFVHADVIPPPHALADIMAALNDPSVVGGNFGLTFEDTCRGARLLTAVYPTLRFLNLCYGDSGIFVRRNVYYSIGGFRSFALFEDLDLLKRLRAVGRFVHLDARILASSRRFENRNFGLMWSHWTALQILYWCGLPPNLLARWYRHTRRKHRRLDIRK